MKRKKSDVALNPFSIGMAAAGALSMALLQGCSTTSPAPVSERPIPGQVRPASVPAGKPVPAVATPSATSPGVLPPAIVGKSDASTHDPAVVVKPLATGDEGGLYTVKQGDTLFSIAKTNGVTVRDIAAWNNIEDPANIRVGQQLRLTPPDGVTATPVPPATPPVAAIKPIDIPPAVVADPNIKREPLGQRVPYSEQAYAQMSKQSSVKPDSKADEKPAAKPDTTRNEGDIEWAWPVQGKVVTPFNDTTMKGIAIAGARGTPVKASAAGRVIFAGTGIRGLGQLVVVRHNATYSSVYAHNDKILVKEGQNVTRGQAIAEMGSSDTDSVKLHFEIRRQGRPQDPAKFLPGS